MGVLRKSLPLYRGMALRCIALTFCMSIMAAPARSETVPILPAPATVAPTAGQLEYFGTASGYLCKYPSAPTGADQSAVALATAKLIHANGEAIYTGSGIYDGKHYSWYQTHLALPYYPLVMVVTQYICRVGSEGSPSYNCGPIPNSRNNPNECCACGYRYDSGQSMCVVNPSKIAACAAQCPAVATGETPFTLDPGGLTCSRPDPCPIDQLPDLPTDDEDYACTQSLDKGAGKDVDGACPPLDARLTGTDGQMQCLANKLNSLSPPIPYNGPSSTIRTKAYQQHLLDIWDASIEIKDLKTAAEKQACASVIANVEKQMEDHDIVYRPSGQKEAAPHVQGIAFDIPKSVAKALVERATMTRIKPIIQANYPSCIVCMHIPLVTGDVQDYIISSVVHPPACNLKWGGSFGDIVHFQLPSQLP